jgi:hypothetical protein
MPVIFAGVARQGGVLLAKRFDLQQTEQYREEIEGVVRHSCPPSVRSGWSQRVQLASSTLYLTSLGDTGALVCLAASGISESVARKMLAELETNVHSSGVDLVSSTEGSLTTPLKEILRSSIQKDGSEDRLAETQKKIDNVNTIMMQNIQNGIRNMKLIEEEEVKAEGMAREAEAFKSSSLELRNHMRMRVLKMKCCAIIVVLCIVGYFVVGLLPEDASGLRALHPIEGGEPEPSE